jgi:hypothetical protein
VVGSLVEMEAQENGNPDCYSIKHIGSSPIDQFEGKIRVVICSAGL